MAAIQNLNQVMRSTSSLSYVVRDKAVRDSVYRGRAPKKGSSLVYQGENLCPPQAKKILTFQHPVTAYTAHNPGANPSYTSHSKGASMLFPCGFHSVYSSTLLGHTRQVRRTIYTVCGSRTVTASSAYVRALCKPRQNDVLENDLYKTRMSSPERRHNAVLVLSTQQARRYNPT